MGVTSVNGKKNVRANSPVVAKGVLVPKVVYLDAKDFKTPDGKTITNALKGIAPLQPVKIEGTADDYALDLGGGGFYL